MAVVCIDLPSRLQVTFCCCCGFF